MTDAFREVDDEVRALRTQALVRRLAPFVIAGVVLLLAAVGIWQFVKYRAEQRAQAASTRYFAADQIAQRAYPGGVLDRAAATQARDSFAAVAADAPGGIATLARLHVAGLDAALGEADAARKVWADVAADATASEPQRQLATLLDVQSRIGQTDAAALKARLTPLLVAGAPWRGLAQESEALIDLRAGDTAEARSLFQAIAISGDAPVGARDRAQGILATLPPEPAGGATTGAAETPSTTTPTNEGGKGG